MPSSISLDGRLINFVEIEAIKQLKARYFRLMDEKRWSDWGEVFTADAVLDAVQDAPNAKLVGRDRIVEVVSRTLASAITVHHGHMPEIEITSATTARGIWAMEDYLEYPGESEPFRIRGKGHYYEEYEKGEDGRWRIKILRLTRLWIKREGIPPAAVVEAQK